MTRIAVTLVATLWASGATLAAPATAPDGRPWNFIVLLVDDLGWTDVGYNGSDLHRTPNIDRLAASGVRFTNGYAACTVCSPTRAAMMTGQYPARLHVTDWITGHVRPNAKLRIPDWTMRLEHRHTTLAERFKAAGYHTAHIGKWHLAGSADPEPSLHYPTAHGFDINIGGNEWGQPASYFHPYRRPGNDTRTNVQPLPPGGKEGDYLTDRLTDEALSIIERWRDQPFFLHFAYYVVHTPLQGKPELVEQYKKLVKPDGRHRNPTYAAMMHSLDESVGRIAARLEALGIADRTVILFTGDNGGLTHTNGRPTNVTDNSPLRVGKGSAYEGGVRVPTFFVWPSVTKAGSVCDEPIITVDYAPTLLQIAGVEGGEMVLDGVSLVPLLKDASATLGRQAIYWHYPHYHPGGATPYGAVRAGDWKLIEFDEDMRVELYNLRDDAGEQHDQAPAMPQRAEAMRAMLHRWRQQVGAQMPTPRSE